MTGVTVKQGTLTLLEHLVPHPLQEALYCIGCSLAGFEYFTHVACLMIYDIEYRYWLCLLVLLFINDFAKIGAPLHALMGGSKKIKGSQKIGKAFGDKLDQKCSEVFDELKS